MIDLKEMIKKVKDNQPVKPPLSLATMTQYLSSLKKLHYHIKGDDNIENMEWLLEKDKILKYLQVNPSNKKPRSPATKRNLLSYINTLFKSMGDEENLEFYTKLYINEVDIVNKKTKSSEDNSFIQSEKIIDMSLFDKLLEKLLDHNLETEYIMFLLLKTYALRNEFSTLIKIDLNKYNLLKKENKLENKNYLAVGKHKMVISRSEYKTYKIYGMKEIVVKDKLLKDNLKDYISDVKFGEQIFKDVNGLNYTNQSASGLLTYYSKKMIGVPLSSSSIFKIVLANFKGSNKDFINFIKLKSAERGTNPQTIIENYVYDKVDEKDINDKVDDNISK